MKKIAIFVITAVICCVCLPVFAQQFPDVPTDHWAYPAIQELASNGIIQGYPDGTFGGKRALTRYEFAQALARAIPMIQKMVGAGSPGSIGPAGPAGPMGPAGPGLSSDELANLHKLIDEFKAELQAQGVDIEALKKDVATLGARLSAVEREQKRVVITADALFFVRGDFTNEGTAYDKDGRQLGSSTNPLQNTNFYSNIDLNIKGRVSDNTTVNSVFAIGNFLAYELGGSSRRSSTSDFTLWNLYMDSAVSLGPLGAGKLTIGRFPLQLTPYTFKMVSPDSYAYFAPVDNGDYIVDGGKLAFKVGKVDVTAFAAKTSVINTGRRSSGNLESTYLTTADDDVPQIAGVRAVMGTPFSGKLGLTYIQEGVSTDSGQNAVYGADLNMKFGGLGFCAEFAQSKPSDRLTAVDSWGPPYAPLDSKNNAWNANLKYQLGKLGIGGGYTRVEENFDTLGSWLRLGRASNLTNVKGEVANLSYALTKNMVLTADGTWLQPIAGTFFDGRSATDPSDVVYDSGVDKITGWKAGVKYALTSANSVDLGFEEVLWSPVAGGGIDTRERYISLGIGHTFNPNTSLKLLYQIVEYRQGGIDPYDSYGDSRGGVAGAEFMLKY